MNLYADWDFIEKLFLTDSKEDIHVSLKKLFTSSHQEIKLVLNFAPEDLYQDLDKRAIVRQISSKIPDVLLSMNEDSKVADFYKSSEPKIFFVDEGAEFLGKEFGCLSFKFEKIEETEILFFPECFRINKKAQDWSILEKIRHSCNALVITDNYLLYNDKNYENTISLLRNLMPKELSSDFEFDITIIGYTARENTPIQKQADDIRSILRDIYPYTINLTIIRDEHHGRYIHTNYFRISCEKGFSLFNNKRIKKRDETTIECQPLTVYGKHSSVYQTRNEEIKKCIAINRTDRMSDKVSGPRKNKLLS